MNDAPNNMDQSSARKLRTCMMKLTYGGAAGGSGYGSPSTFVSMKWLSVMAREGLLPAGPDMR
jgi:hypothetical protein